MKKYCLYISIIYSICFSQWFDIDFDGVDRIYYVSYPPDASSPSGLIINMHGFGGNASTQLSGTQMDNYAHLQNIAVVYPQGINSDIGYTSWNVGTFWDYNSEDDIGFISTVIDDVALNFNIDLDRVYACGYSNGGYMAYELACELSDKVVAFGSVAGNFMLNSNQTCNGDRDIPIIHFHGTNDPTVDYYPPSFDQALTVEQSIGYWTGYNEFNLESYELLNSYVEVYKYYKETSQAEFVHYKVIGGQHEWFWNNWGFNASEELVNFFSQYKLSDFVYSDLLGDLNSDESLNIQDVVLLIDLVLADEYEQVADMNLDESVDVLDIVQLVDIMLN